MGPEQGRDRRYAVKVEGKTEHRDGQVQAVQVTNLSANGCRFEAARPFGDYAFLTLSFGKAETLEAQVCWRIGETHGVRFARPLHPALLDHVRLFLSEQPALVAEREEVSARPTSPAAPG